jgi:hypothetical protein
LTHRQTGDSAQGEKVKAASSAALNILSPGIFTWNRALRRDALRFLPHGEWHANGAMGDVGMAFSMALAGRDFQPLDPSSIV